MKPHPSLGVDPEMSDQYTSRLAQNYDLPTYLASGCY